MRSLRLWVIAVLLFLRGTLAAQPAQFIPTPGGVLPPGLYVHVIDGAIQLSNAGGSQNFTAGQFGYTPSIMVPPVIVPKNPGLTFAPPPSFSSSTAAQTLFSTDSVIRTGQGQLTVTSGQSISTVAISGGTVTVNVVTGQMAFTSPDGTRSTLEAGTSAIIEGGAVKSLMATMDALALSNALSETALSETTQYSLLQAVAAVAAVARLNPNNPPLAALLTNLVTQVSTLAANAGNRSLIANVVAFAVANAPQTSQGAITQAAESGIANSSATVAVKASLVAVVPPSSLAGASSRPATATTNQVVQPLTTPTTLVDPSINVSPSS